MGDISNRDAVESLAAELSQRNYAPHSVALTAGITFYNDWIETDNETWDQMSSRFLMLIYRGQSMSLDPFFQLWKRIIGAGWF